MVIIPVPAIEQHGPQLPIGTDYFTGEELAKLIAQKTDVPVAPILLPGISPYHMEFPGTITLSADTVPSPIHDSDKPRRKPECIALNCGPH
jgi:creatinine amidohydrolase